MAFQRTETPVETVWRGTHPDPTGGVAPRGGIVRPQVHPPTGGLFDAVVAVEDNRQFLVNQGAQQLGYHGINRSLMIHQGIHGAQ